MNIPRLDGPHILHHGRPFTIRGVSLGNWLLLESYMLGFPYIDHGIQRAFAHVLGPRGVAFWETYRAHTITAADFAAIARLGFNTVRIPFTYRLIESDQRPGVLIESGLRWIDQALEWANKHHLLVLLDLHAAPGAQADDWNADNLTGQKLLWENADYRRRTVELWRLLASRYRHETSLLGFDVLCEPVAPDPSLLNQLYHDIIQAIRAAGSPHIIQIEPNRWARDWSSLDPALFHDPQVMSQAHLYPSLSLPPDIISAYPHGTHHGIPIDRSWILHQLNSVFNPALDRPRFLGEFGIDTIHSHHPFLAAWMDTLHSTRTHWCLWTWKDIGRFGLMRPRPDTPLHRLVHAPDMHLRRTYIEQSCGVSFGDYLEGNGRLVLECLQLFQGVDPDLIHRAVREAKRNLEKIHLHWMLRQLASWSDDQLDALARGFSLHLCTPHSGILSALGSALPQTPDLATT